MDTAISRDMSNKKYYPITHYTVFITTRVRSSPVPVFKLNGRTLFDPDLDVKMYLFEVSSAKIFL